MKSLQGKFHSARGWGLLLVLFLGAGLLVAACGEDSTPATPEPPPPTPTPTPPPPPEPEPPGQPTGLAVSGFTENSITWTWNAVEGALAYQVQASLDEVFDDSDTVVFEGGLPVTTETTYTRSGLEPETNVYARVRSAAGTTEAPLYSDWTTHVTGTTAVAAPQALPAPTGLAVSKTESEALTWSWDAVSGATGYQVQVSDSASFADDDPTAFVTGTSYRAANREPETSYSLRVRAYAGTVSAPELGNWSAGVEGTTKEAPPPEPLSTPTRIGGSDRQEDSIVVSWDEVDDAETYEVEQRVEGGDWTAASCGGGDNVVTTNECIASGLTRGTSYEFRVRAIPADTADDQASSTWGTISSPVSTDGPAPSDPVTGGMGKLNVRWESTATTITFIWDRIEGAEYDIDADQVAYDESDNPCEGVDYDDATASSRTSIDLTVTAGQTGRLCVRTNNPDNASENLSFAWAAASPPAPTVGTPRVKDTDKDNADDTTTALLWSGFQARDGFNYEYRVASDPHGANRIDGDTSASDVASACDAGIFLKQADTDTDFTDDNIVLDRSLTPHTGYLLCTRYSNDAGASGWSVPANNAETYTRPAKPPSPTVYSSLVTETATATTVVWRVATRGRADVPRLAPSYDAKTIFHRDRRDTSGDTPAGTSPQTVKAPTAAMCAQTGTYQQDGFNYTLADATDGNDGDGIVISPGAFDRPAVDAQDAQKLGNSKAYVCVRANDTTTGAGPWVLSSSYTVKHQTN